MTEVLQGHGLISWLLDDLDLKEVGSYPVQFCWLGELRATDFLGSDCCGIDHTHPGQVMGSVLKRSYTVLPFL